MCRRIRLWDVASFVVGLLAALAAGAGVMLAIGAWDALLESARVTSAYTALGFNLTHFIAAMESYLGFRWSQWGLLFILAVAGIVAGVWPRITPEARQRRMAWVLIGWLIVGFAIMAVQAEGL